MIKIKTIICIFSILLQVYSNEETQTKDETKKENKKRKSEAEIDR